jgi:hypothetical protein
MPPAWTARSSFRTRQFTPPVADTYATFWYKTGGSKQAELGGNTSLELTVGIFQFDVLAPENGGDGPAIQVGDVIRKAFNRKEWLCPPDGYVKTLVANVKTPFAKPQGGFYRVIVDGVFYFYHRDPLAQDFRT